MSKFPQRVCAHDPHCRGFNYDPEFNSGTCQYKAAGTEEYAYIDEPTSLQIGPCYVILIHQHCMHLSHQNITKCRVPKLMQFRFGET